MKISIIIANFNHAQYIEFSLESAIRQTHKDKEIIIIDDGSTDNSKEVIERLNQKYPEIKTIFMKENKGKWFVLNRAIEEATGEIISLNDADDVSHPQRLERQLYVMQKTKSFHNLCGFKHCYSQQDIEKISNGELYESLPEDKNIIPANEVTSLVYNYFKTPGINHYCIGEYETHGASCLFYKQHWKFGMKFLPGSLGLRCQTSEDGDFNTKMTLLLQKTTVLKESLYGYRRNTTTNPTWLEAK